MQSAGQENPDKATLPSKLKLAYDYLESLSSQSENEVIETKQKEKVV